MQRLLITLFVVKALNMRNNIDNKKDLRLCFYKYLVIPGIIVEILLGIIICTPNDLNLNFLTRPVGGPPGIAIQIGMLPCVILLLAYVVIALIYTMILPYKYHKQLGTFLNSARRFVIFSIMVLLSLDFIATIGWIEFIRWDYLDILNIPVVLSITGLAFIMTIVFLYWFIRIYRCQKIRFFSIKTAEGIGLFFATLVIIVTMLFLLL